MMKLVDQLFDLIFADAFEEAGKDEIDTYAYQDAITNAIDGDAMAEPLLALFDPTQVEAVSERQIREKLGELVRKRKDDFHEEVERMDE